MCFLILIRTLMAQTKNCSNSLNLLKHTLVVYTLAQTHEELREKHWLYDSTLRLFDHIYTRYTTVYHSRQSFSNNYPINRAYTIYSEIGRWYINKRGRKRRSLPFRENEERKSKRICISLTCKTHDYTDIRRAC